MIPQKPEFIQTVHRRGYRFIAPIATDAPSSTPQDRSQTPEGFSRANDVAAAQTSSSTWRRGATIAGLVCAVVLLTLGGVWAWMARRPSAPERSVRVNVAFPSEQAPVPSLNAHPVVTLSPDGERFVYVGGAPANARLFLREMNRFDAVPLPGTEGAHGPFFSPDGDWVAFFAQGSLKKVRVTGDDRRRATGALRDGDRRRGRMGVCERDRVCPKLERSADARRRVGRAARSRRHAPRRARRIDGPTGSTIRPSLPPGGGRRPTMRRWWRSR